MGGACNTYERDEKCMQNFGWKTCREVTTQKTRRKCEDNIRTDGSEIGWEGVDWIHLAQESDQWRALVNTAMNLWVP
jgi:hypothetical protein